MSDIAAAAGTSVAAVSVTLNGAKSKTLKVGPETRERIVRAARELGYRRNPHAQSLATGRSRILGLMLPDVASFTEHDPFYSLVTTGVTAGAAKHGYNVMLYSAAAEADGPRAAAMIDRLSGGFIFVSPPVAAPLYAECERQGIPFTTILGDSNSARMTVNSDDFEGGLLATKHLLGLGHLRIAHLEGRSTVTTTAPRRDAYREALRRAGMEPDPELCVAGEFNRKSGYEATQRLLALGRAQRPTAIFAANDLSAHGAIDAIQDAGLSVPDDIAVVGYDDTWYATITRPALTTVAMNVPEVGRCAAEMLLACIDGDRPTHPHRVLPVSLTIRESCGASKRLDSFSP